MIPTVTESLIARAGVVQRMVYVVADCRVTVCEPLCPVHVVPAGLEVTAQLFAVTFVALHVIALCAPFLTLVGAAPIDSNGCSTVTVAFAVVWALPTRHVRV